MIEYSKGVFGLSLLLRLHGSALIKASIPGLLSVTLYLSLYYSVFEKAEEDAVEYFNHPYAIGILVTSITLLITFRANYGYQRYWEGCTASHSMMSKFMDATVHSAVFHLQCEKLKQMRPPSFFEWDDLNGGRLSRDREVVHDYNKGEFDDENRERPQSQLRRRLKSINETASTQDVHQTHHHHPHQLLAPPRLDGGWGLIHPTESGSPTATHYNIQKYPNCATFDPHTEGFASTRGGRTPSLFLQELAHLSSLLCAVAVTTLRNDEDGDVESPLGMYVPGMPWPECDPLKLPKEVKRAAYGQHRIRRNLRYILGMDATSAARTKYNAARPMLVLGGVSDAEIAFLQRARGPYAKTQLCWTWLSEFVIREHLAGSLGGVGPPIISRIVQFLSDGMKHYNEARKISWIPFPFVHAQVCAFFIAVVAICVPFLMNQYANQVWLGSVLTFLVVTCLAGLHEVARELENPFRNAPNDIPLCTMMAFYNEALITMYAGFHPDSYWDDADVLRAKDENLSEENDTTRSMSDGEMVDTPKSMIDISINEEDEDEPYSFNDKTVPQSVDDDTLASLKEMVEMQAVKIKELQDRMNNSANAPSNDDSV